MAAFRRACAIASSAPWRRCSRSRRRGGVRPCCCRGPPFSCWLSPSCGGCAAIATSSDCGGSGASRCSRSCSPSWWPEPQWSSRFRGACRRGGRCFRLPDSDWRSSSRRRWRPSRRVRRSSQLHSDARYFSICVSRPFLLGLPALAIVGVLVWRGLASRRVLAGALAGLGAGLVSDASWRLYCHVSDPGHVLLAHAGAIAAQAAVGAAAGAIVPTIIGAWRR